MANFDPPFSVTGPRRSPTSDEKANGFPCGAADQTLFNGMFYRLEAELANLILFTGLTPTDTDMSQVRKAIQAMIAAATGGGDTSTYLLMTQARARLPIFAEWQTGDGTVNITSPANGIVRLPGGIDLIHRGIYTVTTVQTDFNTAVSKTYHLRWNPTDGFTLKDLANLTYNPTSAAETDAGFDSRYDDVLVARIVTNAGNVPTITNLVNKHSLVKIGLAAKSVTRTPSTPQGGLVVGFDNIPLLWARTPQIAMTAQRTNYSGVMPAVPEDPTVLLNDSASDGSGTEYAVCNRYGLRPVATIDINSGVPLTTGMQLSYTAIAA